MIPALDPASCLDSGWRLASDLPLRVALAIGLAGVAAWAGAKGPFPGKRTFFWLNLVLVGWIACSTAEHAAAAPACKGSIALLSWHFVLPMPVLWVAFLQRFRRRSPQAAPKRPAMAGAVAAGLLLLSCVLWTNGLHGQFYTEASALGPPLAGLPRMRYGRGPLFWLAALWGHAWLVGAALVIVRALHDCAPEERAQWIGFGVMMLVPWACNAAYLFFDVRLAGADPTPLSFAVAAVGFAWMLRRSSLLRVVPMSRRLLFTDLLDPVLVLDAGGRVVDCNVAGQTLAAGRVPGQPGAPGVVPLGEPLSAWPVFGTRLAALLERGGTLVLPRPERVFDVQVRVLGAPGAPIGRLVQLRDVTERHRAAMRHQAELHDQARRDPLTGLLNRRALAERHSAERARQRRTGGTLSLVLLDVDHFKRINDDFGHAEGDCVLVALARALGAGLRLGDTLFRIGGEEFALLMTDAEGAPALQRVQSLVATLDVRSGDGRVVTCSAGVATTADADVSLDELMRRADQALYAAKADGRACVRPWRAAA